MAAMFKLQRSATSCGETKKSIPCSSTMKPQSTEDTGDDDVDDGVSGTCPSFAALSAAATAAAAAAAAAAADDDDDDDDDGDDDGCVGAEADEEEAAVVDEDDEPTQVGVAVGLNRAEPDSCESHVISLNMVFVPQ